MAELLGLCHVHQRCPARIDPLLDQLLERLDLSDDTLTILRPESLWRLAVSIPLHRLNLPLGFAQEGRTITLQDLVEWHFKLWLSGFLPLDLLSEPAAKISNRSGHNSPLLLSTDG